MTLEVFLAKAGGVVNEEDVGVSEAVKMTPAPLPAEFCDRGCDGSVWPCCVRAEWHGCWRIWDGVWEWGGGSGRGKRRATVEEAPLDKATQQKQRRMIKNRESAARSRERKQAYTVELESQVTKLEDENARLLKEEVELKRQRYKQLMENLIPVTEKRRPPRVLRRVRSMEW